MHQATSHGRPSSSRVGSEDASVEEAKGASGVTRVEGVAEGKMVATMGVRGVREVEAKMVAAEGVTGVVTVVQWI